MYVIGLISGTSVDGIDAALVNISGSGYQITVDLVAALTHPYPPRLRQTILQVIEGATLSMADLAELDDAIAGEFAQAAQAVQQHHPPAQLIASHGQTVFHRPPGAPPGQPLHLGYSLQLGRGDLISHLTQTPTVSNFRQADIAMGGQGAPLVPPIDACLLSHPTRHRCVQNIGGIGNVAYLPPWDRQGQIPPVLGWDTGPGNALIDLAVTRFSEGRKTYDHEGAWAASGTPCQPLIQHWLQHPFFHISPPKSTGRELFSEQYLEARWAEAATRGLSPADFLATLTDFTAATIAQSYTHFLPHPPDEILLCGGGSRNQFLRQCLAQRLPTIAIHRTDDVGLNSDAKEAIAFAVLGFWRYHSVPGNLPPVTGATKLKILGDLYER